MATTSSSEQPLWDLSILCLLALRSALGALKLLIVAITMLVQGEFPSLWWYYVFLCQLSLCLELDFVWSSTLLVVFRATMQAIYL